MNDTERWLDAQCSHNNSNGKRISTGMNFLSHLPCLRLHSTCLKPLLPRFRQPGRRFGAERPPPYHGARARPAASGCCSDFAPGWRRATARRSPSAQNPAGQADMRFIAPCCVSGVPHLTNLRPNRMPLRVDCNSSPWRCGLSAAEALTSGKRSVDTSSSPQSCGR